KTHRASVDRSWRSAGSSTAILPNSPNVSKPVRRANGTKTINPHPAPRRGAGGGLGGTASASGNRLPSGVALRYIRGIAFRIGIIVSGLDGVRRAVVIVAIIRIVSPRIRVVSPPQPFAPPPAVAPVASTTVPVSPAHSRGNYCAGL